MSNGSLGAPQHGNCGRCWPGDLASWSNTTRVTFLHRGWHMKAKAIRLHSYPTMKEQCKKIPSICSKRLYMRLSKDAWQSTKDYFQMEQCQVVCNKSNGSSSRSSIGRFIFLRFEKGRDAFECTSQKALYFQEGLEAPRCHGRNR